MKLKRIRFLDVWTKEGKQTRVLILISQVYIM